MNTGRVSETSTAEQSVVLSGFQQRALKLAAAQSETVAPVLQSVRERGADAFSRTPWPGRKVENWKYTSLQALRAFEGADWAESAKAEAAVANAIDALPALEATRLVFVDGQFQAAVSDSLPEGVTLFSQADETAQGILEEYLGQITTATEGVATTPRRNLFAELNDAWLAEGLLLHVAADATLESPLYIVHISASGETTVANQRLLLVLERSASASVIEHFVSTSNQLDCFVNSLTEIELRANARLHHTRLHNGSAQGSHIGSVHLSLQRDAVFQGFTMSAGSRLNRVDYQMNHRGSGALVELDGIYLAREKQLVDYHLTVEHEVPHCTTQEIFRGIVGGEARAVFNGKIHIHPDAQKTLAELHNRNLLTSSKAEIDTKPELEIYADDVRCAHGATISQLDEDTMHYLRSRGVSQAAARMMLSYGFVNELFERLPDEVLKEHLQNWLRQYFLEEMAGE